MKRFYAALIMLCLAALPLLAAPNGPWEIIRADYGSGNKWVDVTNRVHSLVQNDALNFTVNSNTLGAPSRRGRNRALRLQLQDNDGNNRQVTYRENQQVSLQVRNTYQGGLHINRAIYGRDGRNSDVTSRLNSLIQANQLNTVVNNQNMGGDPAPNQVKTLTVQYAVNGQSRQIVVNEGDTLQLSSGTNYGNLHVSRAIYGRDNHTNDVTSRLNSRIQGDELTLLVNNQNMGGDPAPDQVKTLTVRYTLNGQNDELVLNEGETLRLPNGNNTYGRLLINRAIYGWENRTADVTSRLNSKIFGDQLNLQVTDENMGGDPALGHSKKLTVDYSLNGQTRQVVTNQNDTLRISGNNYSENDLQIKRAIYGWENQTADVTSRLNSRVQGDQLNLQVTDDNMGGDPAYGHVKKLTVDYSLNGHNHQVVTTQNDTLRISGTNYSENDLQIKRAIYGWENQTADVTSRLNSQVQGDQLNLKVTDDNMGGDPAYGHVKKLTVDYSFNGQNHQVVTTQNDTLSLPLGSENGSLARRMNCESLQSDNYGRKYCAADTRGGVRLNRTLSDSNCVQGSSWGYDNSGVWVDNGCRGEFILQGNGSSTGKYSSVTIPNGTELSVRTNEIIDSKTANVDQTYSAVVANDVLDNSGRVTIPKGSDARLVIRSASGGSITSASDLVLDVDSLTVSGTRYTVSTGDLTQQGGQGVGANKKTAIMVGGGAAVGTLIGAIVGGGKGAAIGAAIGAGAGVGTEILTKGKQVRVPAETVLNFRLDQDLRLQALR